VLARDFYPLAIGNRWRSTRIWAAKFAGEDPPWWLPDTGTEDYEFEQVCSELREGVPYMVEKQRWWNNEGNGGTWHLRYRQDALGLYGADICSCEPPECSDAPRGAASARSQPYERLWAKIAAQIPGESDRAAANVSWDELCAKLDRARSFAVPIAPQVNRTFELTILEYPLYPGQNWILRNDPEWMVQANVEAFETLELPVGRVPAYRIRITIPQEPDDAIDILQWWGRCGLMRSTMHFESEVVGEDGEPIGVLAWDEIQDVTDINLVDLRPCTIASP